VGAELVQCPGCERAEFLGAERDRFRSCVVRWFVHELGFRRFFREWSDCRARLFERDFEQLIF